MFVWHLSECVWMWLSLLAQRYCRTLFKRLMNDDTPQPWRIELVSKSGLKWRIRRGGMCEIRGPNASCPLRSLNIKLAFIKQEDGSDTRDARKQTWHTDEGLRKWPWFWQRPSHSSFTCFHQRKNLILSTRVCHRDSEESSTLSRPYTTSESSIWTQTWT